MSTTNYIQIERRPDDIAIITINRPEVLNAINVDVITELSSAIDIVSADDKVKVKDHFVRERILDMYQISIPLKQKDMQAQYIIC